MSTFGAFKRFLLLIILIFLVLSGLNPWPAAAGALPHDSVPRAETTDVVADAHPSAGKAGSAHHSDPIAPILMALLIILLAAKIGGEILERMGQPAVLGELIAGVIIGNIFLFTGWGGVAFLRSDPFVDIFARVGVVILLFEVGLESNIKEMVKVGISSFLVATVGVIAPFILGFFVSRWFLPQASSNLHIFIGATLCATSVGITARVLKDLNRLSTDEARVILGAAVIDDVMGLIILAVVSGIIVTGSISAASVLKITGISMAFLIGSIIVGLKFSPMIIKYVARMRIKGMKLVTAISFAFFLSLLADKIGLATIVGAFAAGLVLDEVYFKDFRRKHTIQELVEPLSYLFVPIFFVYMGIQVKLETFMDPSVLGLAAGLTVAAVAGKQVCGLAVVQEKTNRLAIGIGMVPRGEVGLIFASIGKGMGVVSDSVFSAIIIMVIVTTFITPPLLKLAMRERKEEALAPGGRKWSRAALPPMI